MKIFIAGLALVVAACTLPPVAPQAGNSNVAVRLGTERVSADVIRLTLDNGASTPVGYNLCTSTLQRRTGSEWIAVPSEDVCTMQLHSLNPGRDATFEKRLPSGLPSGEYRYVTSVENPMGTAQTAIATEPFPIR